MSSESSVSLFAQVACIWEASARKPGNVHRFRDFADLTYLDFLLSAAVIAPLLEQAGSRPVGETILEAVRRTREIVRSNTNLGIVLLLTPLAAVPEGVPLRTGIANVLARLDVADARAVYEAIRLATPGGLGRVDEHDIRDEPTRPLVELMALAADHDMIARQYATDYRDVFETGLPALERGLERKGELEPAIIYCHLAWLAEFPDSLIARKRGNAEALEASRQARLQLNAWPDRAGLAAYDDWLRAEGNSRNPGTTADLVAATLFVALRTGVITLPAGQPWLAAVSPPPPRP